MSQHELRVIKLHVPNLTPWPIFYCETCDEAWTERALILLMKREIQCPKSVELEEATQKGIG